MQRAERSNPPRAAALAATQQITEVQKPLAKKGTLGSKIVAAPLEEFPELAKQQDKEPLSLKQGNTLRGTREKVEKLSAFICSGKLADKEMIRKGFAQIKSGIDIALNVPKQSQGTKREAKSLLSQIIRLMKNESSEEKRDSLDDLWDSISVLAKKAALLIDPAPKQKNPEHPELQQLEKEYITLKKKFDDLNCQHAKLHNRVKQIISSLTDKIQKADLEDVPEKYQKICAQKMHIPIDQFQLQLSKHDEQRQERIHVRAALVNEWNQATIKLTKIADRQEWVNDALTSCQEVKKFNKNASALLQRAKDLEGKVDTQALRNGEDGEKDQITNLRTLLGSCQNDFSDLRQSIAEKEEEILEKIRVYDKWLEAKENRSETDNRYAYHDELGKKQVQDGLQKWIDEFDNERETIRNILSEEWNKAKADLYESWWTLEDISDNLGIRYLLSSLKADTALLRSNSSSEVNSMLPDSDTIVPVFYSYAINSNQVNRKYQEFLTQYINLKNRQAELEPSREKKIKEIDETIARAAADTDLFMKGFAINPHTPHEKVQNIIKNLYSRTLERRKSLKDKINTTERKIQDDLEHTAFRIDYLGYGVNECQKDGICTFPSQSYFKNWKRVAGRYLEKMESKPVV